MVGFKRTVFITESQIKYPLFWVVRVLRSFCIEELFFHLEHFSEFIRCKLFHPSLMVHLLRVGNPRLCVIPAVIDPFKLLSKHRVPGL